MLHPLYIVAVLSREGIVVRGRLDWNPGRASTEWQKSKQVQGLTSSSPTRYMILSSCERKSQWLDYTFSPVPGRMHIKLSSNEAIKLHRKKHGRHFRNCFYLASVYCGVSKAKLWIFHVYPTFYILVAYIPPRNEMVENQVSRAGKKASI